MKHRWTHTHIHTNPYAAQPESSKSNSESTNFWLRRESIFSISMQCSTPWLRQNCSEHSKMNVYSLPLFLLLQIVFCVFPAINSQNNQKDISILSLKNEYWSFEEKGLRSFLGSSLSFRATLSHTHSMLRAITMSAYTTHILARILLLGYWLHCKELGNKHGTGQNSLQFRNLVNLPNIIWSANWRWDDPSRQRRHHAFYMRREFDCTRNVQRVFSASHSEHTVKRTYWNCEINRGTNSENKIFWNGARKVFPLKSCLDST